MAIVLGRKGSGRGKIWDIILEFDLKRWYLRKFIRRVSLGAREEAIG
jgi:hypothetical protein